MNQRLDRILPLLGEDDKQALQLTGLPGLGTNHAFNHRLREKVAKARRPVAGVNKEGI